MKRLQLISIAHDKIVQDRKLSEFCLSDAEIQALGKFLDSHAKVHGYLLLLTCNRQEVYLEAIEDIRQEIIDWWVKTKNIEGEVSRTTFRSMLGNYPVCKYLMELSLGFRSAIKGDDQILSQIKKAVSSARKHKRLSTLLERAFQAIMKCNKQVVNETDLKNHSVSLAFHALKKAANLHQLSTRKKSLLIVGAGQMAGQVVKYMDKFHFKKVTLTNRTRSKAEDLVRGKEIELIDFNKIQDRYREFDIIINCINGETLSNINKKIEFGEHKLTIIDLALPEVENPDNQPNIRIITLDQLVDELDKHCQLRAMSIPQVKRMIIDHTEEYNNWTQGYNRRHTEFMLADEKALA